MNTKNKYRWDYIKASRKGFRDAYLDDKTGFVSTHKIHKSKKTYSRKLKHKNNDRF